MESKKENQTHTFIQERIFNLVKTFSFPRLAGTEGERKAVEFAVKTFKDIGFQESQIEKEPFEFSDFYATTLIKLIGLINLTFSFIFMLFAYIYPFITMLLIVIMSIFVILLIRGLRHPEYPGFWGKYYGETFSATNVIVKLPARLLPEVLAGNIVISAHLDSKSQSFKTRWRVYIYGSWLYSGIVLGGFFIAFLLNFFSIVNVDARILLFGIWTTVILISFSNVILMLLTTNNESPGALDNASGMAIVFELSSYFKDHPLDNYNIWFCQFSAEELGTMGSRIFLNNRESQFVKGLVFQINSDMVSSATFGNKNNKVQYLKSYGIFPRKTIAPLLNEYLHEAARIESLHIDGFHVSTGYHTDTVPFHLRKDFSAVDITTRAAAKWTHSKEDTPDKVDPRVLRDACVIIGRTFLLLDKDYQILCEILKSAQNEK